MTTPAAAAPVAAAPAVAPAEASDQRAGFPGPFRSGVLHGRLQGRRLRAAQVALLDDLLPTVRLDLGAPLDAATLFPALPADAPLRLEIGFGAGEHLMTEAAAAPGTGFIGCEPFRNGVVGALQHLSAQPLANVRLHAGDAGEVIDRLPDASLSHIDLLYPDPWPKRRQRKRRFVSDVNLARFARVLRPGGLFCFATDIDDYAGWTLAHVARSEHFRWTARMAADWLEPWAGWVPTRYEGKARAAGRPSAYLTFQRV